MTDTDPECSKFKAVQVLGDSFNSKKSFYFEKFKMGLARGQSAPGLIVQRQAFQKILWSGSQADWPSEGTIETPTTQPPRNKLIPDPAVWPDVGCELGQNPNPSSG